MKKIINKSYAKVNLSLDVLGKLDNGYHSIRTVFQTISLFDVVEVFRIREGIELSTNIPYLPHDHGNIAYRAAEEFLKYTGIKSGVNINIAKRIPVGAGLAGGSANASAVLKSMNELFETKLSLKELCSIGIKLGADVPYCISGGTARAEGIGEILTPLNPLGRVWTVVVKPCISISTPWAYSSLDHEVMPHPDTRKAADLLKEGKREELYKIMGKSFEMSVFKKYPEIESIKAKLTELGFIVVSVDGMGTCNRSKAFHDVCWKNLKDAGFPDRIAWMKAAAEKYDYMDLERVGIYA